MRLLSQRSTLACFALLALGLAPAAPIAAQTAGRNLLSNPGFETGTSQHPWMPAGWDTFPSSLPTVFFGRDTVLAHGGRFSVSIANLSTYKPMFHNWSQTIDVGRELWGKDLTFTVWTRSNGLQGRAYILLQAYRDTIGKMSRIWKLDRENAQKRLGIGQLDDPILALAWDRQYFSENETEWVKRQVRIYVPPSTNEVFVRCGIFGTGQVMFDDASLVASPARPAPEVALHTNLLADPGFEGNGDEWEYSMPPYDGLVIERDSTVAHDGRASVRMEGGLEGMVRVRTGVCQMIQNRNLAGKRVRLTGWVRTDSLDSNAYLKMYCTTIDSDVHEAAPMQYGMNTDWTKAVMEMDTPPGTFQLAAWFLYNAPGKGRLYFDDCSLEVIGPASYLGAGGSGSQPSPGNRR